jgi:hypothetical protein
MIEVITIYYAKGRTDFAAIFFQFLTISHLFLMVWAV